MHLASLTDEAIESEMFDLLVTLAVHLPAGDCLGRRVAVTRLCALEVERAVRRGAVLDLRGERVRS
jgi:hypothetical protein